ncbi:uncharacterized protein LOC110168002 isoform X2 [Boleophthalmus pectinirostris]|uniref:uncharacterized protein LOC110168002 isoform X2 n=1 Tax=Boleophthalmus pectinirostris TaxID=150288 RepID=UPI00242A6E6F|nr:uncharacterized protein LOC110168002 isoform X2 [Boleophthalmus pectinirostris]
MEMTRSKHLGVVHVFAMATLLSAPVLCSTEVVNGTVGSNITLTFRFNSSYAHELTDVGLYYGEHQKMAQCQASSCPSAFTVHNHNATVLYHLSNLTLEDSRVYYTALYTVKAPRPESNRVQLQVMEESQTTAPPPGTSSSSSPTSVSLDKGLSQGLSSSVLTGAVLGPLLLLAGALFTVSWCILKSKELKEQIEDRSIPTVHDRVPSVGACVTPGPSGSSCVDPPGPSGSSLIYSVLDFPQRPTRVLDVDNNAQYATIRYLP